ncbi:MAG: hypothetical protein KJO79_08605 [Verrucomicrobiae bacterium]|nr:hypothetical protein [Verrucomicrobiae bacterium]NNJ87227.1 hypothetical protein [Akkermansiaceae bacterium]
MNSPTPINPAEQVEKIREILVGRDMELVNGRIQQLESKVEHQTNDVSREVSEQLQKAEQQYKASQENIQSITAHIRQQLQQESITRGQQINDLAGKIDAAAARMDQTTQQLLNVDTGRSEDLSKKIENLSSEMASRIDAHSRQIMEHMHREIQQWKTRMDGQISALTDSKVDRQEMTTRLARIASAAMGDAVPPATPPPAPSPPTNTGSDSDSPDFKSLDVFAMPSDDYTS